MLTTKTLPKVLIGKTLRTIDYKLLPNVVLIKGESLVINKVGSLYLYMGDDHRLTPSIQIIVNDFCGNLRFLSIESKVAIELVMEEN